jgi:hypothetical protein
MMDHLKPTDNLHKFMGVGGLFLAICCVIFPVLFFHRTSMEYLAQVRARDEWQVHEKFITERLKTLDNRKNKLHAQLDKLNSGSKVPSNSVEVDKLESRIEEQIESIEDTSRELSLDLELRRKAAENDVTLSINRRRDSRVVLLLGMIAALICSFVSFIGFGNWWKRLRRFRIEAIEAEAQLQAKTEADKLEQSKLDQVKLERAKLEQPKLDQVKLEQATPLSRHPKPREPAE